MIRIHPWKTGTAALMAMTVSTSAILPILTSAPASAQPLVISQRLNIPQTVTISSGARIPVAFEKEKIVVAPDETTDVTLKVANNIVDSRGRILIPADTEIVGQLRPATRSGKKGSQFIATKLVYPNGREQSINAASQVVTKTETINRGTSIGKIATGAAVGAGAAAIIGLLTGNRRIDTWEVLTGGGVGALLNVLLRRGSAEVVVINPEQDLTLSLRSNLTIALR
jgi:hypothetical protein